MKSIDEQMRIIMKGVDDLIDEKELREKLLNQKKKESL